VYLPPPLTCLPPHPVQVNGGFEADADVGPMITPEAKTRCEQLIQAGIDQVGRLYQLLCCLFQAVSSQI